jgi:hypothetical protein
VLLLHELPDAHLLLRNRKLSSPQPTQFLRL